MAAKKRVLVVDDEPGILDLLADVLLASGYEVTLAMNGQKAMVTLTQNRFDLVISDIHMPEWNGFDLLRWMKRTGRGEKVIVMTGSAEHPSVADGKMYPVEALLRKPFRIPVFLETVEALLREEGIETERQGTRRRKGAA